MPTRCRLAVVCASALLVASGGIAQDSAQVAAHSLGLRGGISWPFGDWTASRVNPAVNFFVAGGAFDADLEFAIGKRLTLAIAGGYASLNGSDWEEYVKSRGGEITVSASTIHFALLLRPHILLTRSDLLRVEFGPAIQVSSGSETYRGTAYTYDFLKDWTFGVRFGVDYTRLLSGSFGLSINAAVIVFPSGVEYIGGESRTMISLPVTIGVRFLL